MYVCIYKHMNDIRMCLCNIYIVLLAYCLYLCILSILFFSLVWPKIH